MIPREEANKTIEQDFSISCAAFEKKLFYIYKSTIKK